MVLMSVAPKNAKVPFSLGAFFSWSFIVSLIYFLIACYFNSIMQLLSEKEAIMAPSLPDFGHDVLPYLTFWQICNYWIYGALGATFIRFLPIWSCVNWKLTQLVYKRFLLLQGTTFWLRGVSVFVTVENQPMGDCVDNATGNIGIEGFLVSLGIHATCSDVLFSGHTALITLLCLIWTHYSKGEEFSSCCGKWKKIITPELDAVGDSSTCFLTAVIAWIYTVVGYFFIIATHFHYSNDVWIGFLIASMVFRLYHFYIKTVLEKKGYFSKLIRWIEDLQLENVNGINHTHKDGTILHDSNQHMEDDHSYTDYHLESGLGNAKNKNQAVSSSAIPSMNNSPRSQQQTTKIHNNNSFSYINNSNQKSYNSMNIANNPNTNNNNVPDPKYEAVSGIPVSILEGVNNKEQQSEQKPSIVIDIPKEED